MAPPKVKDAAAARMLAHAVVQEAFELAGDEEPHEFLAKARELFTSKVEPELHPIFDEALAEYAQ